MEERGLLWVVKKQRFGGLIWLNLYRAPRKKLDYKSLAHLRQWHKANSGKIDTNLCTVSLNWPSHVTTAKWKCCSCKKLSCGPPLWGWCLRVASSQRCLTWTSHSVMGSSTRLDKEIPKDLAAAHAGSAETGRVSSVASTFSSSESSSTPSHLLTFDNLAFPFTLAFPIFSLTWRNRRAVVFIPVFWKLQQRRPCFCFLIIQESRLISKK